jgi:hypothetical protein
MIVAGGQFTRLQHATEEAFVRTEAQYLAAYDPPLAASAGREGLEAAARLGLKAAQRCGWTEGPQVRLYLQLVTSFGSYFDTDRQYAWLHPFLDGASDLPAAERSRLLYWHATRYIDSTYGESRLHAIAAVERGARLNLEVLADVGREFSARALALLARLHPQRNEFVQSDAGRWLTEKSSSEARRLGLAGPAAAPLLMCLMFGFGHGVADDPLYPWVRRAVAAPDLDGERRTAMLLAGTQDHLAEMLRQFREARR